MSARLVPSIILAMCCWVTAQWAVAEELLTGDAYTYAAQSYADIARGDLGAAEKSVNAALLIQPNSVQLGLLKFDVLMRKGDERAAQLLISELARQFPDKALIRVQRGFLAQKQHQYQAAVDDFLFALKQPELNEQQARNTRIACADSALQLQQAKIAMEVLAPYAQEDDPVIQTRLSLARSTLSLGSLNAAYVFLNEKKDTQAVDAFTQGFALQTGTAGQYTDAAYAAKRIADKAHSIEWFSAALDKAPTLSPTTAYNFRREIEMMRRQYGVVASVAYQIGGFSPASSVNVVQGGLETYWQPESWLNQNNRLFQAYGRLYQNLYDGTGGKIGSATAQGAVGARLKPIPSLGAIVVLERMFSIGNLATDDWLLHVAYSDGAGGDWNPAMRDWSAWSVYTDSAYFVNAQRFIQSAEVRYGHSWALGQDKWTVTPHWVVSGDYDDHAIQKAAFGTGPGVSFRYWFREDKHQAPASWIDWTMQYRFELTQAPRARGLSLRGILWY